MPQSVYEGVATQVVDGTTRIIIAPCHFLADDDSDADAKVASMASRMGYSGDATILSREFTGSNPLTSNGGTTVTLTPIL